MRDLRRFVLLAEESARHVQANDFSYSLPLIPRAELTALARVFNGMLATMAHMNAELEQNRALIEDLADRDPLTGLFNRRRFQAELHRQLSLQDSQGYRTAVLLLDVDDFKHINEAFGYTAADEILVAIAARVQKELRGIDVIARLSADEFAILRPQSNALEARAVAQRILRAVDDQHLVIEGQPIHVTVSIGVALADGSGATADSLLERADGAMAHAKEQGRNRYCFYTLSQDPAATAKATLSWLARVHTALERDRFVFYLQPLLDLRQNRTSRYEVLLRMLGDDGEPIPPQSFLSAAERFGLIRHIDRWTVRHAIRLLVEQRRTGRDLCLQVNLSGRALTDPELIAFIEGEMSEQPIDPAQLIFEITETAAVDKIGEAQCFVAAIKEMGCGFGLDDFGVGFSTFNYLKHLPVDYLKIDGGFIRNLPQDRADQHLVRAIVQMAQGLGKKTVAESVEDGATLGLLRDYGVDYAQGYYIGRPGAVLTVL